MELYRSLVLPTGANGSYPVIIAHCISTFITWRAYEEKEEVEQQNAGKVKVEVSSLYPLVAAYFCYGYGGGLVRDWVMAQPPTAFTNPDVLTGWMWGYIAVYHTNDMIYRLGKPSASINVAKIALSALDAVDTAGGVCASCEKGKRLFPNNPNAPFVAGMLISLGGSLFRYMEQRFGRDKKPQVEWAKPTSTMKRALAYVTFYLLMRRKYDADTSRLTLVTIHVVRVIFQQFNIEIMPFLTM